jgi:hypothetical protein
MRDYSAIEHLARSIFAKPTDLMAMFSLYCDDSGTHAESKVAVAACFVAPIVQWECFDRDWRAANEAEDFGVFHMADFVAHQKRFGRVEWQDSDKRDRTVKRLINIIVTRKQYGFFTVVEKDAYDAEVPQDIRDKYKLGKNHYTFAVRMCMANVSKWRLKYGHKEPIQFVFDRLTKGKGEIDAIFEAALKEGDEQALTHGISRDIGWSFQDKAKILPLQAADMLAWESLHYMQKVSLAETPETPRKSFAALTERTTDRGFHNRESLRQLIAWVKGGR